MGWKAAVTKLRRSSATALVGDPHGTRTKSSGLTQPFAFGFRLGWIMACLRHSQLVVLIRLHKMRIDFRNGLRCTEMQRNSDWFFSVPLYRGGYFCGVGGSGASKYFAKIGV